MKPKYLHTKLSALLPIETARCDIMSRLNQGVRLHLLSRAGTQGSLPSSKMESETATEGLSVIQNKPYWLAPPLPYYAPINSPIKSILIGIAA